MTGGLIAFYSIVYGVVMSLISFVIALVFAAIAGTKNMKSIWVWGICFQMAVLLYLLFEHYFDGAHYTGPIRPMIIAFICILIVTSLVAIMCLIKTNKWKTAMWAFSFIIPICVFVFCVDLDLDPRPFSQEQIESMTEITLPDYRVTSYEEHSPGGDDWESNCTMRIKENADLDSFRVALDAECLKCSGLTYESDDYCVWDRNQDIYHCRKQFDIEHWLQLVVDINNKIITYQYIKI